MATHYEILGVRSSAGADEIRKAYLAKARRLHPDGYSGRPHEELLAARRAMQDVNEAWRVLRDSGSRAAYDRKLKGAPSPMHPRPAPPVDDPSLDRVYHGRVAEPGDVTVAIARAAPWVVVLLVLGAIVVFTAFAKHGSGDGLVGKCIVTVEGRADAVPCTETNEGRVVNIVNSENLCTEGTTARVVAGGTWYCLRPADSG